jgi:hypothetical protein
MPYIKPEDRKRVKENGPSSPGELNYAITSLCLDYFDASEQNYAAINAIIGALDCAKLEFYRRVAVSYEKKKIKENGDVY